MLVLDFSFSTSALVINFWMPASKWSTLCTKQQSYTMEKLAQVV